MLHVERHPRPGRPCAARARAPPGGKGANQAVAAARAGAGCELVGRVGRRRRRPARTWTGWGLGRRDGGVAVTPGAATGTAVICVDGTARTPSSSPPARTPWWGPATSGGWTGSGPATCCSCSSSCPSTSSSRRWPGPRRGGRGWCSTSPRTPTCRPRPWPSPTRSWSTSTRPGSSPAPASPDASLLVTRGARGSRWGEVEVPATPAPRSTPPGRATPTAAPSRPGSVSATTRAGGAGGVGRRGGDRAAPRRPARPRRRWKGGREG